MNDGFLLRSFLNPPSQATEPFDFFLNQYFHTRASFRQFDPFKNGYIMGFMMGILSTLSNVEFMDNMERNWKIQVHDVLFSVLGNNSGFKSLTIIEDKTNGSKAILIHNFFFESKASNIGNGNLTETERKSIESWLLQGDFDQRMMEYLFYDLNKPQSNDQECDLSIPFIERMAGIPRGSEVYHEASDFRSLKGLIELHLAILKNISNDKQRSNNVESLRSIIDIILNAKATTKFITELGLNYTNIDQGFAHGVLLATRPIHKFDIRVATSAEPDLAVRLRFEPIMMLGDPLEYEAPIVFNLLNLEEVAPSSETSILDFLTNLAYKGIPDWASVDSIRLDIEAELQSIVNSIARYAGDKPNYISTYFLGMVMAKENAYNVYRSKKSTNCNLILQVVGKSLILFNFDHNIEIDIETLGLYQFQEIKRRPAMVISIFGKENINNKDLMRKNFIYHVNITTLGPKTYVELGNAIDQYYLTPTTSFPKSIFHSPVDSNDIFAQFTKVMLDIRYIARHDKLAFAHFIQGLFHIDKQKRQQKVDKFHSETVFSVHARFNGTVTVINFVPTNFAQQYIMHMQSRMNIPENNRNTIGLFFGINGTTGDSSFHMWIGSSTEIEQNEFTHSACFTLNKTEVSCSRSIRSRRSVIERRSIISTLYATYVTILEEVRKLNSMFRTSLVGAGRRTISKTLAVTRALFRKYGAISSNIGGLYYGYSDMVMLLSLSDDDMCMISGLIISRIMNWKADRIQSLSNIQRFSLPIIGVVISIIDIHTSIESYSNGDHSALAVFNIVKSFTTLAMSLTSLGAAAFGSTLIPSAILPFIPIAITIVSAMLFFTGRGLQGAAQVGKIGEKFELSAWEKTIEVMNSISGGGITPQLIKLSNDFDWNTRRLQDIMESMEKNDKIRTVITSAGCYDERKRRKYAECDDIKIYMRGMSELDKKYIAKSDPIVPENYTSKYTKTCHVTGAPIHRFGNLNLVADFRAIMEYLGFAKPRTGYKPQEGPLTKDLEATGGTDYISTVFCLAAFGVSRQTRRQSPRDVTEYWLHGNSTVYASSDTINIFHLSGGEKCRIYGGFKGNTFVLASEFKRGHIEGSELAIDILILAFSLRGSMPRFILGKGNVISAKRIETTVSEMVIKYIDKIIVGPEVEIDDVHLFCDLKIVDVVGNEEYPTSITLRGEDCQYDLILLLHGYANIVSFAMLGNITYKFDRLNGNMTMMLLNGRNVSHRIEMNFINFTEITDFTKDKDYESDVKVGIYINGSWISIHMKEGAESLKISFRDGITINYRDGMFYIDHIYPKSKAQLWFDYNLIISLCDKLSIIFQAYSERDQEVFTLTNEFIGINKTEMNFAILRVRFEDEAQLSEMTIKCKAGYNIILIEPRHENGGFFTLFVDATDQNIEALIIDLTLFTDAFEKSDTLHYLDIDALLDGSSILLNIREVEQYDTDVISHRRGVINLSGMMFNHGYKKVKVCGKFDFTLEAENSFMTWKLIPSARIISPFSPMVVLDPSNVEKNQTIWFDGRVMNNYDVVELDETTLLITDLASNMMKSLLLVPESAPLLAIVIEDYKSERMRYTKLKFQQNLEIYINKLEEDRIIEFETFESKIDAMTERLDEEGLMLQHD